MEILRPDQYGEYEEFVRSHPNGGVTQSVAWHGVKPQWGHAVVVSRDEAGRIVGGASVLSRRMPLFGVRMLYAPRGPVCNYHDWAVLEDLQRGVDELARQNRAYLYKIDPDIPFVDTEFATFLQNKGFRQFAGKTGFETIQCRFNYRLYLNGRSEEELLANLTQQTRRNVRIAMKKGVEVRVAGREHLDDFMRIMQVTGERDGFTVRGREYFEGMLDALGEHARLYLAFYEGQVIAGAIATNYAGKTCYVYGASDNAHRNVMSTYLVQWEMIRWAVETGCAVYDFQGISGVLEEGDHLYGLYRFKKGFNGQIDELAGEFDYIYMPVRAALLKWAIALAEKLRVFRRKLVRR